MVLQVTSWSDIGAVATAISAICTMGVLFLTWKTVNEMVKNRIETSRPIVVIDYEFRNGLFYLFIENIGQTSALNVNVKSPEPIYCLNKENKDIRDILFKEEIKTFPPRKRIETLVDSDVGIFSKEKYILKQNVSIEYGDIYGNKYSDDVVLNLSLYENLTYTKNDLYKICKMIEKVSDQLKEINSTLDKKI